MKKLLISLIVVVFLVGAISQVADAARWRFHQYLSRGGTVTVYGTINCQTVGESLFEGMVGYCHDVSGWVPPWCNDYLTINQWDQYTCGNIDSNKVAVKYHFGGQWRLYDLNDWINVNVPDEVIIPGVGDSLGTFQYVHTIVDLADWLADPRPLQDTYDIVDGECPDLPGYLISTTAIVFDPFAPPDENPFQTTPLTGRLWRSCDIAFDASEPGDIPTLTEWGLIILALLLLTAGTIAVIRRRKTVAARAN